MRRHIWALIALTCTVLLVTWHLWSSGSVPDTHDGIYHAVRLSELAANLQTGQFPVRWAAGLDQGQGLPLFNYVYPLPYYLGLPLLALGLSPFWSVKLLTLGFLWLGGLGVYLLARRYPYPAVVGAIIYVTAPYQLLNIFVRGALGETLALGLIPWTLLAGRALQRRPLTWYHPLPLALLFLAHTFLSFIWLPVYVILVVTRASWRRLGIATLLSLGLAAWYLLPATFESSYLLSTVTHNYTFAYQDHFVYLWQLFRSPWGYGFSVAGTGDGMSFMLGAALLGLMLLLILFTSARRRYLPLILGALYLTTPWSLWIWQLFPPLALIQFPWRLLMLPLVSTVDWYQVHGASHRLARHPLVMIGLLALALGFALTHNQPRYPQSREQYMAQWYANRTGTTTSAREELLPKWVQTTDSTSPTALPVHYFPGLEGYTASGQVLPLAPDAAGRAVYQDQSIPPSEVRVRHRETPLEQMADYVSGISLGVLIWLARRTSHA